MTATHLSHFGLKMTGESEDRVFFEGSLANCKRMAFAHGCQVSSEEGPILESGGGKAIYAVTPIVTYWLVDETGDHAGMIKKIQDGWILLLSREVWLTK